ncbi:3-hydroxyacyl-CoA dehydrogenase NAD-binding domain-containing protein [Comamonas aquatica]|uniref:3-hydroxyacyl-CoA dehydrogenase NAD-binding domain-containing protein n=1 Tax=Comamonas aquatica TaxID=225991 RepID=A0AA42W4I1_9BURK|nr:3-hydroxyacyl-CoA dehydrogenase NAD-binding domain-containing protein [Comamonas aquatica]MDH1429799.1 3-hydroxyacyl-CoA dehydrogenase NAD-binding domain-containing protein [Comamonas aquatica]MDH1606551.1 3-hydroxyacyl-CoA dehydrogenase NAD-binding domain-containing protein [Comamonas aquatica]MDH1619306.1 3-hydroxyacyl-CoA dehydrogenase NAD-binding domain-containing protein [Comamonas aquatica]MDH2006378.1 3-hydroxyacyl-CoA dehydrogenase NAD-binding domain-containing protein [Comamonas aqu
MSSDNTASVVQTRLDGEVLVVSIHNPPVNALGQAVRAGLLAAVEQAAADAAVKALLIVGEGKAFIAGADIREFGKPAMPPSLPEVCNAMEASPKLVVAAIHGPALGGGLEVALSAHYRLALPKALLGLPEVNLGLLPGAGGTQRAPRVMGVKAATELMLSGKHLSAKAAAAAGLVDQLMDGDDVTAAGLAYTRGLLAAGAPVRRTRDIEITDKVGALAELEALAIDTAKKARGLFSPLKIIECAKAAVNLPFEQGLAHERALFVQCLESPQRQGLIHAFFAERETAKIPEAKAAAPRAFAKLAIIGGGTMGAGITVAALDAGYPVIMVERDAESIARGQANVEKVYNGLIAKGRMTEEGKAAIMARYTPSTSYDDLKDVDLVIEAVFEDLEVKKAVFKELDRVCKPGAVLATNTSYLDIDAIADATARPQDVIGLHFFSPANIMKLLEIVVPAKVSADVVATAFELAKKLKKVPVRAGVCDGFIGNRILAVYKQAADYIMEDGASPYEIDAAVRGFGYPMGPFQVTDLAGGDIGWATRKRRAATRDPKARYVEVADRICENGWFGQKTGRGFYLYPQGARVGQPDPEVLAIVDAERAKKGVTPRQFTPEEIMRRYMAAMVNEGAKVVEEGIALRPLDVDVTFISGYGFPRWRGGPMKWADMQGLDKILADIQAFEQEDPLFWKPAALLKKLVAEGKNFDSLNQAD